MLSSLKLNSVTYIGRDEEKKLSTIVTYLIDTPEAAEFLNPVDWQGKVPTIKNSSSTIIPSSSKTPCIS